MTLLVHFIEFRKYSVHSFYYIHYKCVLFTFAALNGLGQIYIRTNVVIYCAGCKDNFANMRYALLSTQFVIE